MATTAPALKAEREATSKAAKPARHRHDARAQELAVARPFGFIQPKLVVGPANDRFEREADAVADRVMRMPDGLSAKTDFPTVSPLPRGAVQRLCHHCEEELSSQPERQGTEELEEKDEAVVQPKPQGAPSGEGPDTDITADVRAMRGGGQPLPPSERAFFEPRFGRSFGDVRVHSDQRAAKAARAVSARAFTIGPDLVFAAGQYAPGTTTGRALLAHELTHVVQQGASTGPAEGLSRPTGVDGSGLIQRAGDPAAIPPGFPCPTDLTAGTPAGTDLLFGNNGRTITPAHTTQLTTFRASWLASGGTDDITVHGYASVDGDQGPNWTLSCDRAQAVMTELIRLGVPAARISILAHGESTDFGPSAAANRHAVVSTSAPGFIQLPLVFGTLTARDNFVGRSVTRFGVGEIVDLDFASIPPRPAADFGGLVWSIASGGGTLTGATNVGTGTYTAPGTTDTVQLELRVAGGATVGQLVSSHTISIVQPNSVSITAVAGTAPNVSPGGGTIPAGTFGAGFLGDVFIGPNDVSFMFAEFGEGTVMGVVTPPGSFLGPPGPHGANTFGFGVGGNAATGTPVTTATVKDQIATARPSSGTLFGFQTCGVSDFLWAIPWEFRLGTTGARTAFATANHHETSAFFCNATIEKAGAGPFCRRIDGTVC